MMDFSVQAFSSEFAQIKMAQADDAGDLQGRERWKDIAKVLAQLVQAPLGTGLVRASASWPEKVFAEPHCTGTSHQTNSRHSVE